MIQELWTLLPERQISFYPQNPGPSWAHEHHGPGLPAGIGKQQYLPKLFALHGIRNVQVLRLCKIRERRQLVFRVYISDIDLFSFREPILGYRILKTEFFDQRMKFQLCEKCFSATGSLPSVPISDMEISNGTLRQISARSLLI